MTKPYRNNPDLLRIYLIYRLCLALVLLVLFESGVTASLVGSKYPEVFRWSMYVYALICAGSFIVFKPRLLTRSEHRISFLLIVDLIAILAAIHASGGPEDGLGFFVFISAATASIFIKNRLAYGYASMITLFLLGEAFYGVKNESEQISSIFYAGVLGFLVFATTAGFIYLTNRIRQSDILAFERAEYAEHLKQLSKNVISRMRTGIITVDEHDKIELINDAAIQFLNFDPDEHYIGKPLRNYAGMAKALKDWNFNPVTVVPRTFTMEDGAEIKVSFARLESDNAIGTILFIEDNRAIRQQAQQLKLASLGQLTATIAHEVRNPLGAIAHAAQLLKESPSIAKADKRLTEIILQHSDRVNELIENTLQLSRRQEPTLEHIDISRWLLGFIETFKTTRVCDVSTEIPEHPLNTTVDPSQLQQVLVNLCENGLRYGQLRTNRQHIKLKAGINKKDQKPYIEIVDDGEGIPPKDRDIIFDPFFTTDKKGTGLGLYISKELCEINHASLYYYKNRNNESCFKIVLAYPKRRI